jgi:hypothetical protein
MKNELLKLARMLSIVPYARIATVTGVDHPLARVDLIVAE